MEELLLVFDQLAEGIEILVRGAAVATAAVGLSGVAVAGALHWIRCRRRPTRPAEVLFVGRRGDGGPELFRVGDRVRRLPDPRRYRRGRSEIETDSAALVFAEGLLAEVMRCRPARPLTRAFAEAQLAPLPDMVFNLIRNVGANRNRGFTAAVMRSTDKGATWSAPIEIDRMMTDGVTDPADGHAVRTGDLIPQIAVDDQSGALYVVWQDDRFTGQEQIALSSSDDGGLTWSPTQRISKVGGVNQAFTPTVRVADDGTVAVQHDDFRFDNPATTPPLTTDVWLLRSDDGGASFTEERVGSESFDMATAPDALGYFVGDYAGLDFAGDGSRPGFKPFHVRANSGNLANRTDVFSTTASTSGP